MAKPGHSVSRRGLLANQATPDVRGWTPAQQSKGGGRLVSATHSMANGGAFKSPRPNFPKRSKKGL
jgi:hypothetical protein